MILECAFCQRRLNTPPNANIPYGRPFTFVCPSCKQKNTVTIEPDLDLPGGTKTPPEDFSQGIRDAVPPAVPGPAREAPPFPPPGPPHQAGPPQAPGSKGGAVYNIAGYNAAEARSYLALADAGEGLKTALVIYDNEEVQETLREKLTNMGYKVSLALNVRDAAKQLKFGTFQVVLLQEDYYGANIRSNQLLKAITNLEVRVRHRMFIALIGPEFTSLDDLVAFSLSLDTVINTKDLDDIERILISATEHVAKFFSTYNELRAQRGIE